MPKPTPEQQRKMLAVAKIIDDGEMAILKTILEFQDFVDEYNNKMTEAIEEFGELFEKYQNSKNEEVLNTVSEFKNNLLEIEEDINDKFDELEKLANEDKEGLSVSISEAINNLESKISEVSAKVETVKNSIPELPPTVDLSDIWEKLNSIVIPDTNIVKTEIEQSLPNFGQVYRDALEGLEGDERLDKSAIKGLEDEIKKLREELRAIPRGGKIGGMKKITSVRPANLTSQVDGVTKTFTMPADTLKVLGVWGTQFPVNFSEGTDWTFSGRTLTLTSAVNAPESGQTLWALIETQFYA